MEYETVSMEYKVGDKVVMTDEDNHMIFPEFYPSVGTVGEIVEYCGLCLAVKWPDRTVKKRGVKINGSEHQPYTWFVDCNSVESYSEEKHGT